ncbi:MAG: DUF2125 domain-containing protein [Defluviicoccus sp.]|nr:DUF2125 domain-containing protein [Defluviicoccus sp.]
MARRAVYGTAALIGLAAVVYSAAWWVAADRFRGELDGWAADMRGRGWSVSYDLARIEGYPASLTAVVEVPSIGAPEKAGGWRWRGPRMTAKVQPWNFGRIALDGAGDHRFQAGGADEDPVRVAMGNAFGLVLRLADAEATKIVLRLGDIAIDAPGGTLPRRVEDAEATVLLPDRPGRADAGRGPEPAGPTVTLGLRDVDFGEAASGGRLRAIDEASLTAKLIGPLPRGATATSLAVWRDGGGTLEIGEVSLRSGKTKGKGSGTVALDRNLQPLAALSIRVEGYADLVRSLVAHGWLTGRDAGAIRLGLDLFARASTGQPGTVALPITVQNRRLFLGPISAMRLPPIEWGK